MSIGEKVGNLAYQYFPFVGPYIDLMRQKNIEGNVLPQKSMSTILRISSILCQTIAYHTASYALTKEDISDFHKLIGVSAYLATWILPLRITYEDKKLKKQYIYHRSPQQSSSGTTKFSDQTWWGNE